MSELKQPNARVLAYYLPQFHPVPENDEMVGKGCLIGGIGAFLLLIAARLYLQN